MSRTLAARVSLAGCVVWFTFQTAAFARLSELTGDRPLLLAFAPSDADQRWLTHTNPECQRAFQHAGDAVLAVEEAFLAKLRKLEIAAIDAGLPNDEDPWTADAGGANLGLWRAINVGLWGNAETKTTGLFQQALSLAQRLTSSYETPDINLLALANPALLPERSADDAWGDAPAPPAADYDDQPGSADEREEFVPAEESSSTLPVRPSDDLRRAPGFSAAGAMPNYPRFALNPNVTNEATARSIIGSSTLGGLVERNTLTSPLLREILSNNWGGWTKPSAESATPIDVALSSNYFPEMAAPIVNEDEPVPFEQDDDGNDAVGDDNDNYPGNGEVDPAYDQPRVEWEFED